MSERIEVIATLDEFRLVRSIRDQKSWPGMADLTLEVNRTDAMGEPKWDYVNSWCLSFLSERDRADRESVMIALKMLAFPEGGLHNKQPRT